MIVTTFYDVDGGSDGEHKDTCAKTTFNDETEVTRHWIKRGHGRFYNPRDGDPLRNRRGNYKYTKVNKEVFDFYVRFLLTGKKTMLHYAERSL